MKRLLLLIVGFCVFAPTVYGGMWTKKTSIGGTGRHRGVGGSAYNKGYFGLGHVNGAGADISYRDWWEYNPATDSWSQKADYPVANHGAVCFSLDNRVYVGGGSALSNEFYAFDPLTNSWTPIASCPLNPGDVQAFSASGKGYVLYTNQLAEYSPTSDTWAIRAPLPINASNWSCAFSNSTSGFVKVGHSLYEYKPSQNIWISRANHPGLSTGGSYAFCINGIGYVTSGYVGALSTVTEEVWAFNPASNAWTRVEDFPGSSRRFPSAFTINDKGYFGTGTNGINLNDAWEYDPSQTAALNSISTLEISLYPNPCVSQLHVGGLTKPSPFVLYSALGERLEEGETSGLINVSLIPSGSYILLINQQVHVFYKE